jgi:hypothetical protein
VQSFMRWPKRLLLGMAFLFVCLTVAESVRADSKVHQDLLHSTGMVAELHHESEITFGAGALGVYEQWLAGSLAHAAGEQNMDSSVPTLLMVAVGVLLILGILERRSHQPTNSTAARAGEVDRPPRSLLQDKRQTRA